MEKKRIAHSNFKKGLNDYHDGENVTHYLGNSDYNGANLPDENIEKNNLNLTGKEAQGNELLEEFESEQESK
jgi:hypothetical protein